MFGVMIMSEAEKIHLNNGYSCFVTEAGSRTSPIIARSRISAPPQPRLVPHRLHLYLLDGVKQPPMVGEKRDSTCTLVSRLQPRRMFQNLGPVTIAATHVGSVEELQTLRNIYIPLRVSANCLWSTGAARLHFGTW